METLGIEPTLALRQLERSILDQDPALDLLAAEPPTDGSGAEPGPRVARRPSWGGRVSCGRSARF